MWCWCRPKAVNMIDFMVTVHRDVDPTTLAGRLYHGGENMSEGSGTAPDTWFDDKEGDFR